MQFAQSGCGSDWSMFLFSEEERCALVDMVRFGSVDAVAPSLREQLMMNFAQAAVLALYGKSHRPKPEDIEGGYIPEFDPSDGELAITFIPLMTLQDAQYCLFGDS